MELNDNRHDSVLVLDFGAQYSHLIARKIRECGVRSELVPYDLPEAEIQKRAPKGLVLSGGPTSIYDDGSPHCDPAIFSSGIPILGICYGLQLIVDFYGGKVRRSEKREYGKTEIRREHSSELFKGLDDKIVCWMSHSDTAETLPKDFTILARSNNSPAAAIQRVGSQIYGVQFHPEVSHTPRGQEILRNYLFEICHCKPSWKIETLSEQLINEIKKQVGNERVLCAMSGGVDSATVAVLLHNAIGEKLTCIFVDHGLLRSGEADHVTKTFLEQFQIKFHRVDSKKRFLRRLDGVDDPEKKRLIIGEEFARVFSEESVKRGPFEWLAQGTLYPDVVESSTTGSPASRIKSHHNVAGLPHWLSLKVLEPLRELYKDEVRRLGSHLGLSDEIIGRHPFPGPGLAVRILGIITPEKLRICREASRIVEEELREANLYSKVWQAFAIVGDDKAVGVLGDARSYGSIVTIRIVESTDAMTADWTRLPHEVMAKMSDRITNEVSGVSWVNYAISSKPPSTIEPQ
uniref:GMP synthase [glutamine-hydrolyzing] n=1 Tax=uncultured marine thaumarchaeote KM3_72_A09 TaxID=1456261 RepID=A0A075HL58_9ARCH|nr:GMP synthase (guaA) [uncultured marine thaumarchaeote KM3_72_A09]